MQILVAVVRCVSYCHRKASKDKTQYFDLEWGKGGEIQIRDTKSLNLPCHMSKICCVRDNLWVWWKMSNKATGRRGKGGRKGERESLVLHSPLHIPCLFFVCFFPKKNDPSSFYLFVQNVGPSVNTYATTCHGSGGGDWKISLGEWHGDCHWTLLAYGIKKP